MVVILVFSLGPISYGFLAEHPARHSASEREARIRKEPGRELFGPLQMAVISSKQVWQGRVGTSATTTTRSSRDECDHRISIIDVDDRSTWISLIFPLS